MPISIADSSDAEILPEDILSDSSVNNARSSPFIISSPDWSDEDEDCDGGIPEDMDFHFEFLNEKQKVLTRAALYMTREDEYTAFTARRTQSETNESTTSALWEEAKELLASMERGGVSESNSPITVTATTTGTKSITSKRGGPRFPSLLLNPKRPRIDLSVVNHILSCSLQDKHNIMGVAATATSCDNFVSTVLVDGHWMAKALKKFHKVPTVDNSTRMLLSSSSSWGIHKDPFGGGDTVLLNPDIAAADVMDIEQSLTFTAIPQLIVTPTPPFSVVHANKAFLVFSGLESHDVIGQAVESLLHNVQPVQDTSVTAATNNSDAAANAVRNSNNLVGWMAQEHRQTMPVLPCHVRVVPVVDRRNNNAASSSPPCKTASMSHIVLQVQQLEHVLENAMIASTATPPATNSTDTTVMDAPAKVGIPPSTNHGHIFGMIG